MAATTGSNTDLIAAIRGLSAARELPPEIILEALKAALRSAYDKIPGREAGNVSVEISDTTGETHVFAHYTVIEEQYIEDPESEMTPEQARQHKEDAVVGDIITFDVTPDDFGRIAAQTAKQVILQRIREAEREQNYLTYADREGEIVYGTVQTANRDLVTVALDRVEAILPKSGQMPGERYAPNQRLRVYVSEVKRSPKGPQIIVSRTHKLMLKRLMELEIPEIFQGAVEIKAIAREAGSRSKVAVWSTQDGVDPVGACVGMRGVRIQGLVRELGGEKIDVVEWDPDPRTFIKHALSPARVVYVWLEATDDDNLTVHGTANVVVPDDQLSLSIGREGQNARLAAKLTGWRIDIRAESEAANVLDQIKADEETKRAEQARHAADAVLRALPDAEPAPAEETAEPEPVPEETEVEAPEEEVEVLEPAAKTVEKTEPVVAKPPPPPPPPTASFEPKAPEKEPDADTPAVRKVPERPVRRDTEDPELDDLLGGDEHETRRKKKVLVRDPVTGRLIAQPKRKRSRQRPDWEEDIGRWSGEDDFFGDSDTMGFTEDDFVNADEGDDTDIKNAKLENAELEKAETVEGADAERSEDDGQDAGGDDETSAGDES